MHPCYRSPHYVAFLLHGATGEKLYDKSTSETDSGGGEEWELHKDLTRDGERAMTNRLFLEHHSLIDFVKTAAIDTASPPPVHHAQRDLFDPYRKGRGQRREECPSLE